MKRIQVEKDVKVAVYDLNPTSSKVIVLIHGWPLSEKMYEYQKEVLINAGYRVITMDLRGFGNSDVPASGYGYDYFASDIYHVVNALSLKSFILAGYSMGGGIVSRYMGKYDGYGVKKLCLFAAATPSLTKRPDFPYGVPRKTWDDQIQQAATDRAKLCGDFKDMLLYSKHSDEIKHWFELIALSASGIGTVQSAFSIRDEDCRRDLMKIKVPTGIFHGKQDKVVPYELAIIQNKMIRNSQIFTLEKSAHGVFYDELPRFNSLLLNFIEK